MIVQFYDSEMEDTPFLAETELTEEELKNRGVIRVIPADFYRICA